MIEPRCKECTLNRIKCSSKGSYDAPYLVVVDKPATGDLTSKEVLTGQAGVLLTRIFKALGVEESDLMFTSLVMCRPPNRDLTEKEFNACHDRWKSELAESKARKILFCGSQTIKLLFDGSSVNQKRCLPFEYEGRTAVATYAPGYILQSPGYFPDLLEDITKLVRSETLPVYNLEELSEYIVIQSVDEAYELLTNKLTTYEKLSFDIETTGLDPRMDKLRCIGIGNSDVCYIIPANLFTDVIKKALADLSRTVRIIAHYSNFEYKWMFHLGCDIVISEDTLLKHHEIDERGEASRSLKFLGTRYKNTPNWSDYFKKEQGLAITEIPEKFLFPYLAHDIKITDQLDSLFDIHPEKAPPKLMAFIMRARRVLSKMTHFGIPVDRDYLFELYHVMYLSASENIDALREALDNDKFNPRSAKMVSNVLFEEMGFPKIDGDSTGKKVMHQLRHMYPEEEIIAKIDDTRKLLAAQSTFVRGMYQATNPETSMMYGEFNQHKASTGRLSSSDPNLQNIQRRGEIGRAIRNAIIPPKGYDYIGEADYSQIEVYFAAILSGDKAMLKLLSEGGDIYRASAAEFFGKKQEEITDEEREYFKPIILGSLYLRGARAIAEQNHTSVEVEQAKQDLFFKMYPDYHAYAYGKWSGGTAGMGECLVPGALERAKQSKFVETMFGRKRRFPAIFKANEHEIRREALNAPIQGSASDCNLYSLVEMYERAEDGGFLDRFRPWNIIHDACLFFFTEEFKPRVKPFVSSIMLNPPIDLPIKLKIDFKIGKRWGDLVKWID